MGHAFSLLPLRVDPQRLTAEFAAHPHSSSGGFALVSAGGDPSNDSLSGPMLPTPLLDSLHYTRTVLASLNAPIGRTRWIQLLPGAQHEVATRYGQEHLQIHVATSHGVTLHAADQSAELQPGEMWVVNTWWPIRVVGSSPTPQLVIETVGSGFLFSLLNQSASPHARVAVAIPDPRDDQGTAILTEETVQSPIATAWQQRLHARTIITALPHTVEEATRTAIANALEAFLFDWAALDATHGGDPRAAHLYAALFDAGRPGSLRHRISELPKTTLNNGVSLTTAVAELLVNHAIRSDIARSISTSSIKVTQQRPYGPVASSFIDRPVFVVGPPGSNHAALLAGLSRAAGVFNMGAESNDAVDGIAGLHPADRNWSSDALAAADATPHTVALLIDRYLARCRDRDGHLPDGFGAIRLLEMTPKNSLRIPFLAAAFPDALFVYLHRGLAASLHDCLRAWTSGNYVTYPQLPEWSGPAWSLSLIPGWRDLRGKSIQRIVAGQWDAIATTLLNDLATIEPDRWHAVDYDDLLSQPNQVLSSLSEWLDLDWDRPIVDPSSPPRDDSWTADAPAVEPLRAALQPTLDRIESTIRNAAVEIATPTMTPAHAADTNDSLDAHTAALRHAEANAAKQVFGSTYTASLPELLRGSGSSVLLTTYQSNRVILLRADRFGTLNTHLRSFPRPMGVAVSSERLSLGVEDSVWSFTNQRTLAARLAGGPHDACFVPKRSQVTGDVRVHEMAFAGDELWIVNTRFSCLSTLDADHSFVPRWRPTFITALAAEDRCHLNGLAIKEGRPAFVTAMGITDEFQGWRRDKVGGGVVIDVDSGAIVCTGLTMPHSPRWHAGRLWVLDSGEGHLATVDLMTGSAEPVVRLPGFVRGLAFIDHYALVGLSRAREHVFAGLPLAAHTNERLCGLWVVDTNSAQIVGQLSFDGAVDEIFDVQVMHGMRWPELLEPGDPAIQSAFLLPPEASGDLARQSVGT
jgi:uncharacterized protein (TIGR03032 family)